MNIKTLKVKTQKIIQYEQGTNKQTEKYINLGYLPHEEVSLDKLGYHFTPRENFASIQETGLRPKKGSNSSGAFGKEALDKTFFSNGKNGAMQLFNRLVGASCEMELKDFREDKEKAKYLLDYQKKGEFLLGKNKLTVLEGFEYARRYMQDCSYFGFEAIEPEYTKIIDEQNVGTQVANVNSNLDNLIGIIVEDRLTEIEKISLIELANEEMKKLRSKINENIKVDKNTRRITTLTDAQNFLRRSSFEDFTEVTKPKTTIMYIDKLMDLLNNELKKEDNKVQHIDPKLAKIIGGKLSQMRAQISIQIREKSKPQIDKFRGEIISSGNANYERIDYNEDMVAWVDVEKYPHNAHTMIIEDNGEKKGVVIGGNNLSMLSLDGEKPATAVELTKYIYERSSEEQKKQFAMNMPGRKIDTLLIEDFYQYVDLYEQYKDNPSKLQEHLKEFEKKMQSKYKDSKQYNLETMDEDRIQNFVGAVIKNVEVGEK